MSTRIFAIASLCIACARPDSNSPEHLAVEQAVHRALIDSAFIPRQDWIRPELREVLLIERFARAAPFSADQKVWLRDSVPGLPKSAIADFERVATDTSVVLSFPLSYARVRLVSDTTIKRLFALPGPVLSGWTDVRAAYPNGWGILTISRVGLSRDKTWAIVYASHQSGWVSGASYYYVLRKDHASWRIQRELLLSVS